MDVQQNSHFATEVRLSSIALSFLFVFIAHCAGQSIRELPLTGDPGSQTIDHLAQEKRWAEVVTAAHSLTISHPDDAKSFYWLGTAKLQLHDAANAIPPLRTAQKLGLDTSLLHESLGLAYYDLNQFVLFEQQMRQAADKDPKDFRPLYYLGLYQLTIQSDATGALAHFDQAIEIQPDDWKSLYEAGNCLEKLAKPAQAAIYYKRAITSIEMNHQRFGWPFQGMARLLLEHDPQQALQFATKAVEAEPDEYSNYVILAKVYKQLGRLPEAIHEAQTATSLSPNDASARYLLFLLLRDAGQREPAQNELRVFRQINTVYGTE
jgi:tetratricopeptide (TPR) repeat protein